MAVRPSNVRPSACAATPALDQSRTVTGDASRMRSANGPAELVPELPVAADQDEVRGLRRHQPPGGRRRARADHGRIDRREHLHPALGGPQPVAREAGPDQRVAEAHLGRVRDGQRRAQPLERPVGIRGALGPPFAAAVLGHADARGSAGQVRREAEARHELPRRHPGAVEVLGAPLGGLPARQPHGMGPPSDPVARLEDDERPARFMEGRRRREPRRAGPDDDAVEDILGRRLLGRLATDRGVDVISPVRTSGVSSPDKNTRLQDAIGGMERRTDRAGQMPGLTRGCGA